MSRDRLARAGPQDRQWTAGRGGAAAVTREGEPSDVPRAVLGGWAAAWVFGAFAFAYFFSALLRAVTATLAPVFSTELALKAGDLGLLAGAYFAGFALLQLPLGSALDRWGPRRTLLVLLAVAVSGCAAFASADSLAGLIASRLLIGAGLAACLMAPLTCYRHRFSVSAQWRANSWMLMTGSLGMLASTLPAQWLLPVTGWRGLFWLLAIALLLAMVLIAWGVPRDEPAQAGGSSPDRQEGYAVIWRHPLFMAVAPLGFVLYGGMVAVQSLWAGPWMTQVHGLTSHQAAGGLFLINLCMLLAFFSWGLVMPRLQRRGWGPVRLMTWGLPASLCLLAWVIGLGREAGPWHWSAWCVATTFVSISQPAVGAAFASHLAGRALSAFNLVIFAGVFSVQWGLGLGIDLLRSLGWDPVAAFRGAFLAFGVLSVASYFWFVVFTRWRQGVDNRPQG